MIRLISKCEFVCMLCGEILEIEVKSNDLREIELHASKRNWLVKPKMPLNKSQVYCSDCKSVFKPMRSEIIKIVK